MCASCEFRAAVAEDWVVAGAVDAADRAAMRARVAAILTRVLAPAGVAVQSGLTEFRLTCGPAGVAVRHTDALSLWAGCGQVAGRALDPLDPVLLGVAA